jgi:hypothetical protein
MNPVPSKSGKIWSIVALAMVAVTLYWSFTYTGPYRTLAELQLKWFGSYMPEATALAIILGFVLAAGGIKLLFRGAERPVPGASAGTLAPKVTTAAPEPWLRYARYVFLLVPFGIGVWAYNNGTHAGSLRELSVADFENGTVGSNIVYADVQGHLSKSYMGREGYLYIPMTSEENSKAPAHVLVGVNEKDLGKRVQRKTDGTFLVRGVADKGLEGDVKYAFEKNGIALSEPIWVVHTGRAPSDDKMFGLAMFGLGVLCAGIVFGLESYRKKKTAAIRSLPAVARG